MDDHTVTGRVVAVLDAVADLDGKATLAALTRSTAIPKPTVRRIAADLVARGLLQRGEQGYRLGPRLLQLGARAAEQHGLRSAATPYVQDLFSRTGEIAWMSAFTDTSNALIGSAYGSHRAADMRRPWPTTIRSAGFLTSAAGKVLLAYRPELMAEMRSRPLPRLTPYTVTDWRDIANTVGGVRDGGVAIEHEQTVVGYSCIAVGVHGPAGEIVGAIGVAGRTSTLVAERMARPLLAAASKMSQLLAAPVPPSTPVSAHRLFDRHGETVRE